MENLQVSDLSGIDWAGLWDKTASLGFDFGIQALTAIVIFYVGRLIVKVITNGVRKVMTTREVDKILESFVTSLVYWALMTFVIIATINQLGIQTASLIAIMGAAGLAVGLALQGSLANFAAGVLIVMFRPYRTGDWVEAAGVSGSVVKVQILTTILKTGDNKEIIVPNGQIMNSIITNYSANDTRRVDLTFGVGYGDDLDLVRSVIRSVVEADPRVLKEPECLIAVAQLADSSVNFTVRPWVNTADYWSVYFDLTEAVKKRFDKEGISIPFPQRDVHVYQK
ncbi:MAG: mechanosensitive ion channel [Gammaproteobacteria bacterium]|nr:mechanosensitive ion channel [Gammaproteobacteria bacterium]MDH5311232.1 mechanosensitive ion channel [Gammaproteobacteria bacterium]